MSHSEVRFAYQVNELRLDASEGITQDKVPYVPLISRNLLLPSTYLQTGVNYIFWEQCNESTYAIVAASPLATLLGSVFIVRQRRYSKPSRDYRRSVLTQGIPRDGLFLSTGFQDSLAPV